jgi:hypothetical protein
VIKAVKRALGLHQVCGLVCIPLFTWHRVVQGNNVSNSIASNYLNYACLPATSRKLVASAQTKLHRRTHPRMLH